MFWRVQSDRLIIFRRDQLISFHQGPCKLTKMLKKIPVSIRTIVCVYIVRFTIKFGGELLNNTFLERLLYKESENQCLHLPRCLCGCHIEFLKMAVVKLEFVISRLLNKLEC